MNLALLNETRLVEREIANVMDRHLLIAEIRKRPALWDFSNGKIKSRVCVPDLWKDVARNVQSDVEACKRKWKNLRDAYRAELKRIETRIESDIFRGVYNPKTDYNSKWVFFEPMSFINNSMKKPRLSIEYDTTNSNSNGNEIESYEHDSMYDQFHSICDIKLEPQHSMAEDNISLADSNEEDSNMLYNDDKYLDTNQPTTSSTAKKYIEYNRQNDTPDDNNDMPSYNESQYAEKLPEDVNRRPVKISIKNFSNYKRQRDESDQPTTYKHYKQQHHNESDQQPSLYKTDNCKKCCQNSDKQMQFLENLEKDEQNLITSTRRDISHSNKLDHIGDSDYNFLVSFLPQIKKMSDLQNLQFRAKMSELVLNVLTPSMTANVSPPMPPSSS